MTKDELVHKLALINLLHLRKLTLKHSKLTHTEAAIASEGLAPAEAELSKEIEKDEPRFREIYNLMRSPGFNVAYGFHKSIGQPVTRWNKLPDNFKAEYDGFKKDHGKDFDEALALLDRVPASPKATPKLLNALKFDAGDFGLMVGINPTLEYHGKAMETHLKGFEKVLEECDRTLHFIHPLFSLSQRDTIARAEATAAKGFEGGLGKSAVRHYEFEHKYDQPKK